VAILVTLLWSSSFVFIKWGLSEIPPLFFATLRYALAFLVLAFASVVAGRRSKPTQAGERKHAAMLAIAGLSGYTIAQGLQFVGLYYLPAVTTSFLLNFNPFFVLVLGTTLLGERVSVVQVGGLGVAILGAWAFFSEMASGGGQWFGVLVVLVSGVGWAIYVVVVRKLQKEGAVDSLRLTTVTMGVGVAGMAVLTLLSGEQPSLTAEGVPIVVWLATVNTALAFFLWNWTLRSIPAYELTVLQDIMLVEIALFALLFLGEAITLLMALGIVLVLAGVVIVQLEPGGKARGQ
jgi:drug/metabolite transporter (DMT)-like permease